MRSHKLNCGRYTERRKSYLVNPVIFIRGSIYFGGKYKVLNGPSPSTDYSSRYRQSPLNFIYKKVQRQRNFCWLIKKLDTEVVTVIQNLIYVGAADQVDEQPVKSH
jgi:hypothetical protein